MIVSLSKEEVRACADIALNRWMMKWGSIDRPNYANENKRKLESEVTANIRTIVAEYAVSKLYKLPMVFPFYPNSEHAFRKNFPDVLPCLEVKTVRTRKNIPVFPKDIREDVVIIGSKVLDDDYYSDVEVYGWIMAEECVRPEWKDPDENSWRIPPEAFKTGTPPLKEMSVLVAKDPRGANV